MTLLFSLVMLLLAAVLVTKLWDDQPRTEPLSAGLDRDAKGVKTPE